MLNLHLHRMLWAMSLSGAPRAHWRDKGWFAGERGGRGSASCVFTFPALVVFVAASAPGRSLSSSQQQCLWQCAQRWSEVQHFVGMRSRALLQQQGGGLLGAADTGANLSTDSLLS